MTHVEHSVAMKLQDYSSVEGNSSKNRELICMSGYYSFSRIHVYVLTTFVYKVLQNIECKEIE